MKRVLAVLVAVTVLMAGGSAVAAAAAPAAGMPSPPVAVTVVAGTTPDRAVLSWSPPSDAVATKVFGYSILRDGGDKHLDFWQSAGSPPSTVYRREFVNLYPSTTYTFALKSWSAAGGSAATKVSFTTASTVTGTTVFAVRNDGTLVAVPAGGGAATTVATGLGTSDLVTDGRAVFWADTAAHVVRRAVPGAAPTTVASGLTGPTDLAVDAAGTVWIADGRTVVAVSAAGARSVRYTSPTSVSDVTVTRSGTMTAGLATSSAVELPVATVTAAGQVSTRILQCGGYGYCSTLIASADNALWVRIAATGASGFSSWYRFAPGAVTPTGSIDGLGYYAVGLDAASTFRVAATDTFCTSIGENTGSCTPDRTVTRVLTFDAGGAPSATLAVSGLTLSPYGSEIATAASGAMFINAAQGLVRLARTGGAATALAAGVYRQVAVVG